MAQSASAKLDSKGTQPKTTSQIGELTLKRTYRISEVRCVAWTNTERGT